MNPVQQKMEIFTAAKKGDKTTLEALLYAVAEVNTRDKVSCARR